MDDLTQRYYEAEMRYLREAGKEFAQAYPDRAAMLNLDKPGARDPYVERLFEGFAFLMGRLREKLDDDLPELTEGKEFAQAYPDRAAMLNLDKPGARDPYVERLFEGFAFLMGRLREKLDDDLPELTEGLVS